MKFFVSYSFNGYYITDGCAQYLHKDGTISETCGSENFFDDRDAAQAVVDKYYDIFPTLKLKKSHETVSNI